jgi:hypothetical protein
VVAHLAKICGLKLEVLIRKEALFLDTHTVLYKLKSIKGSSFCKSEIPGVDLNGMAIGLIIALFGLRI